MDSIKIGSKIIGPGHSTYIIAEIGINHNGDAELAKRMVKAAAEAGVDAVKFQTFTADKLLTKETAKAKYIEETTGQEETFYDMFKRLELSKDDYNSLVELCDELEIDFLSTPFDEESADFLYELGVPAYKVASGDLTNLPFLQYLALKKIPILLSTGMSFLGEVEEAIMAIKAVGNNDIALLHCVSNYPPAVEDINLLSMSTMKCAFGLPVGYSDHFEGNVVAGLAVGLGASIIEKHFTLDKNLPGPDQKLSADPQELKNLVETVRIIEKALGSPEKKPAPTEWEIREIGRRSVVAVTDIKAGTLITKEMITTKRPGTGIHPKNINLVIGRIAKEDIAADELISWDKI